MIAAKPIRRTWRTESKLVTVCSKCLRASCWLHIFVCDENRSAGLETLTVAHLRKLGLENEQYWGLT